MLCVSADVLIQGQLYSTEIWMLRMIQIYSDLAVLAQTMGVYSDVAVLADCGSLF